MIKSIKELRNKYRRRPIAILGAGPNLPDDLKKIPENSILIGINYHASRLVNVDFTVFADHPQRHKKLWDHMNKHVGRRLTHIKGYSDWILDGVDYWDGGMSATFATWAACYMAGDPVLLCGMDCYRSGYFYQSDVKYSFPLDDVLSAWRKCFFHCKNSDTIRAVSGPLVEVFGEYETTK